MTATKIEWTEATWNPIVGCSLASPGCTNCYAMGFAGRIEAANAVTHSTARVAREYDGTTRRVNGKAVWTGKLALADDHKLTSPLRRKKPTTYFVNSMGDLFHEDAPDEWIDKVFAVMALAPQHTFQVLTKRSARMREYLEQLGRNAERDRANELPATWQTRLAESVPAGKWRISRADAARSLGVAIKMEGDQSTPRWPLPNVWLGVSTEDQRRADERIPDLLATPAAIRFISAEPLLGPIDLTELDDGLKDDLHLRIDAFTGDVSDGHDLITGVFDTPDPKLDWVIAGGESGADARPTHPDWIRALRDQCADAGTPFFFKQWGAWAPQLGAIDLYEFGEVSRRRWVAWNGDGWDYWDRPAWCDDLGAPEDCLVAVGKKAAGRLLDGVEHNGLPEICP